MDDAVRLTVNDILMPILCFKETGSFHSGLLTLCQWSHSVVTVAIIVQADNLHLAENTASRKDRSRVQNYVFKNRFLKSLVVNIYQSKDTRTTRFKPPFLGK